MGQATLVSHQIDHGQVLLDKLRSEKFDVTAACWMKSVERELWYLYLVSKDIDQRGLNAAYLFVSQIIRNLPNFWIESLDLMLISPTNEIAQDLIKMQHGYSSRIPKRFSSTRVGHLYVEEAFLYPPTAP